MQRTQRHPDQLGGVFDQRGFHAFLHHADAFVDVGNDAAVGIEEPLVVHDNRGLADLAHVVQRFGHGHIAGLLALDDLDQQHLVDGREEVDADELLRVLCRLCQFRDRQGRGVGGKDAIGAGDGLHLGGHVGLDGHVLEHRFDDQVAAFECVVIGGGVDQPQHGLFLFGGRLLAGDPLVKMRSGIGFALVGGLLCAVDQHDLDARQGRDQRDPRAHHARADNADLLDPLVGRLGAVRALFQASLLMNRLRIMAEDEGFIRTLVNQRASILRAVSKGTSAPS